MREMIRERFNAGLIDSGDAHCDPICVRDEMCLEEGVQTRYIIDFRLFSISIYLYFL